MLLIIVQVCFLYSALLSSHIDVHGWSVVLLNHGCSVSVSVTDLKARGHLSGEAHGGDWLSNKFNMINPQCYLTTLLHQCDKLKLYSV